jgi:hypothetical protein
VPPPKQGLPAAISFTVETDGRPPDGQPLGEAIEQVDRETGAAPAYYMIHCAHPSHFEDVLETSASWVSRIGGCARTRRPRAMRSWTRQPNWTRVTRSISELATPR